MISFATGNYAVSQAAFSSGRIYLDDSINTLNFGSPLSYEPGSVLEVINTARNKAAFVSGVEARPFWLYPDQVMRVHGLQTRLLVDRPRVYQPQETVQLFIEHTSSPSALANDGLTENYPLPSIQASIEKAEKEIDAMQLGIQHVILSDDFEESFVVHTKRMRGGHIMDITGDPKRGSNFPRWRIPAGATGATGRDWSGFSVGNLHLIGPGSRGFVSASQFGIIDLGNLKWGDFTGGLHIEATNGGSVGYNLGAEHHIEGPMAIAWNIAQGSRLISVSAKICIDADIDVYAWLQLLDGSLTMANVQFPGSNRVRGRKFLIDNFGSVISNGVVLPGDLPGLIGGNPPRGAWY